MKNLIDKTYLAVEIVLTGRGATDGLIAIAALLSEADRHNW
jgi:ATP:corrinoid adenosyltransferase